MYEQTGMSFSQLANTRPHLVLHGMATASNLCCWALPVFVFQCSLTKPLAPRGAHWAASHCVSKESYFHKGRRGILNESCTQLFLWNTHNWKLPLGLWGRFLLTGKCSARSCCAPLLVLHLNENWKFYNNSFYGKCAQVTVKDILVLALHSFPPNTSKLELSLM